MLALCYDTTYMYVPRRVGAINVVITPYMSPIPDTSAGVTFKQDK